MSEKKEPEIKGKSAGEGWQSWCEPKLVIPIVSSILLLILGQLTNTFVDIKYGPEDSADFIVITEPPGGELFANDDYININVSVENRHNFVCPYDRSVYLRLKTMDSVTLIPNKEKYNIPPFTRNLTLYVNRSKLNGSEKEIKITIEGIGGDGKERSATYVLNVYQTAPDNNYRARPKGVAPKEDSIKSTS